MTYVYRHIRLDKNEPFYIGIGSDTNYQRAYSKSSRNVLWKKVVNVTDYQVEIIMDNLTKDIAKQKEIEFILLYGKKINKTGTLVNITDGGESGSGFKHTQEAKKRIGEASKLKDYSKYDKSYTQTQEYRDKISKINKGRKMPDSMREKTSLRMKNRVLSEEHKEKLRNLRLGIKVSNETKEKMRLSSYIGWEKRKNKNI
tara:strand:- start:69 stop:668 length:600 start_codon:yes stop_codon:yes gene_type:complete